MREADAKEVWLSSQKTPHDAIHESLAMSLYAWSIMLGDKPIGMFGMGATSVVGDVGVPWLLGTNDMLTIRRQFVRESKAHVEFMLKVFPRLKNFVHVDNAASITWLKYLDFELGETVKAGPFMADFIPFERHANV